MYLILGIKCRRGVDEVVITMQDDKYPVTVKLHYVAYQKENLIKTFTEISHREKETCAAS